MKKILTITITASIACLLARAEERPDWSGYFDNSYIAQQVWLDENGDLEAAPYEQILAPWDGSAYVFGLYVYDEANGWMIGAQLAAGSGIAYNPVNETITFGVNSATTAAIATAKSEAISGGAAAAPVQSVNGQTGAVSLTIPTNTNQLANGSGFLTGITSGQITAALGFPPLSAEVDGSTSNEIELPPQAGNSGKVLSTNGSASQWITPAASTVTVNAPLTNGGTSTTANLSISAATTSSAGSMSAADKTKLDTVAEEQRAVVTVAGGAGRVTWTYPAAYGSGIVPVVQAVAVKPTGSTTVSYNTAIWGDPTNTSVTIEVASINNSITGVLALIGIATPAPNGTKVHIIAKAP